MQVLTAQRKTSDANTYWHQRQLSEPGYRLQPQRHGRCPPPPSHVALSPPHTGALCKAPLISLSLRKPNRRVQCSPCPQFLLPQPAKLAEITLRSPLLLCCADLFWTIGWEKVWAGNQNWAEKLLLKLERVFWGLSLAPAAVQLPRVLEPGPSAPGVSHSAQVIWGFPNSPTLHSNTGAFRLTQFQREEIPHFPNYLMEQTGFFWQTIHDKRSGVKTIQQDPKNLNVSDYGKEISLCSNSGNLWPSQLTTDEKGKGAFPELRQVICWK